MAIGVGIYASPNNWHTCYCCYGHSDSCTQYCCCENAMSHDTPCELDVYLYVTADCFSCAHVFVCSYASVFVGSILDKASASKTFMNISAPLSTYECL